MLSRLKITNVRMSQVGECVYTLHFYIPLVHTDSVCASPASTDTVYCY